MSFAKVIALASGDDRGFVPLPVFPSRVYRQSSIYVRTDSTLTRLEELAGKRIGVPEWAQTAAVYSRGVLAHEHGVDLRSIQWFQAGVNEAGRKEKVRLELPPGLNLTVVTDRSLTQMLLDGTVDAVFSARPPRPFGRPMGGFAGCSRIIVRSNTNTAREPGSSRSCMLLRCAATS